MEGDIVMGGFSHGQQRTIVMATQAAAALSFISSIIIVSANFRFKQLRTYSFQLVVWFAVCDIFVDLSFFMGTPHDGSAGCYTQAVLVQFFQIALIQWTVLISQSLHAVASKSGTFDGSKRMLWNHLWAWGVSAVLTFGPSATNSYGKAETAFCMIQTTKPWDMGSMWRFIFVAVCALSIAFVVWTHLTVAQYLHRAQRGVYLLTSHGCNNPSSIALPLQTHSSRANVAPPRLLPSKTAVIDPPRTATANGSVTINADVVSCARVSKSEKTDCASAQPGLSDHHPREAQMKGPLVVAEEDVTRVENGVNVGSVGDGAMGKPPVAPKSTARRGLLMRRNSSVSIHGGGVGCSVTQGIPNHPNGSAGVGQSGDDDTHASRTRWTSGASSVRSGGSSSQVNAKNWLWSASKAGFCTEERTAFITDNDDFLVNDPAAETLHTVYGAANRPLPGPMPASSLRHGIRTADGGVYGRPVCKKYPITAVPRSVVVSSTSLHSSQMAKSALDFGARNRNVSHTGSSGISVIARTHPRPLGLIVKDRAGRLKSWARSTSSNDADRATASRSERDENRHGDEKSIRPPLRVDRPVLPDTDAPVRNDSAASGQSRVSAATAMSHAAARRRRNTVGATDMGKFVSRVKWYPVIYALCWVFTLINGLVIIVMGQNNAKFTLVLLAMVTARLQGVVNFLYYGLNDRLKQAWFQDLLYRNVASSCSSSQCCCFIFTKKSNSSRRKHTLPAGSLYRRSQVPHNSINSTSEEDTTDTARPPSTTSAAATAAAQQPSRELFQGTGITRVQVTTIEKRGKHHRNPSTAASAAASIDAKVSSPIANQTRLSYKKQGSATLFTTPRPDQYHNMGASVFASTPERPQRPARGASGPEGFDGLGGVPPKCEAVARKKNRASGGANQRTKHNPARVTISPTRLHMEASYEHEKRSRRKHIERAMVEASTRKVRGEEDERTSTNHKTKQANIGRNVGGEKWGKAEGSNRREGGKRSREGRELGAVRSRGTMKPPLRVVSPKSRARPKVVVTSMPRTQYRAVVASSSTRSLGRRGGEVIMTAQQLFQRYSSSDIKSDVSSATGNNGGEGDSGEGRDYEYGIAEDEESGYAAEGSGVETEVELFERATTEASSFFSDDGESIDSFESSGYSESPRG